MIVKTVTVPRKRYSSLTRNILVARCDECYEFFTTEWTRRRCTLKNHFCSYKCQKASQKPGGAFANHLKQTFLDKLGVINPSQLSDHKSKTEATCLARYGATCGLTIPTTRIKAISKTSIVKAHASRKKNGTLKTSGPETKFYELLITQFGTENVKRWVTVNGWSIDVHLTTQDVYIQFDGVFWHGLDRPIVEIKASVRPVDQQIFKKWNTDRAQDAWFTANKKCLVRVTDVEFKEHGNAILDLLEQRIARVKGVMG